MAMEGPDPVQGIIRCRRKGEPGGIGNVFVNPDLLFQKPGCAKVDYHPWKTNDAKPDEFNKQNLVKNHLLSWFSLTGCQK